MREGDHVARIAHAYGFADHLRIWNHPNNADLKSQRRNPNVLNPGDLLYIPDKETKDLLCATDQRHNFVTNKPKLMLRLTIETLYDGPLGDTACDLLIGSNQRNLKTGSNGQLDEAISPGTEDVTLLIRDRDSPFTNEPIPARVGDLDPVEELSGQVARLNNLGYNATTVDHADAEARRSAVEEFQCENDLAVDGICGLQTQARLLALHGC